MPQFLASEEESGLKGSYDMYKAEADSLCRNGYFREAIKCYTSALLHRPDDKVSLVCRSKCYMKISDNSKALQDADASLAEDKNYYLGMFQKAEALFSRGDFEMALVYYHRGNKLRPEFQPFRLGIQKALESICNCVGTPDRVKLTTAGDLSYFVTNLEKKSKKKGALCTQTPQTVQRTKRPLENHGSEKTIKQMLGDLYGDRKFLEKLLMEIDTRTYTGRRVTSFAEDGMAYLDKLASFWQQVKPIYARKYEQRLALNRGRSAKISPHDYIQHEIEKAEAMFAAKNYEAVLQKSHTIITLLESYTEGQLSRKMSFLASLHSLMGNAYLEMNDFENAEKEHQTDLTIGESCYADNAELRALDNLGRVHAKSGNFHKAIEVWERKLPMSKEESETAWLCLELGRCYLQLDNTKVAKEYGERSLTAAEDIHDDRWKLYAYVLISQADVKSMRLSSALISFEKAYELSILLRDYEARVAIRKAIADVNNKIHERESNDDFDFLDGIFSSGTDFEIEVPGEMITADEQGKMKEHASTKTSSSNLAKSGTRRESTVTFKHDHLDEMQE